ncbi:hypothetical protein ACX6XY_22030 [Streptomyces sp. O3]
MTDSPAPSEPRQLLMELLQARLSALPMPAGAPELHAERLLAFLGGRDTGAMAEIPEEIPGAVRPAPGDRAALVDAALLSVIEAFESVAPGAPATTPEPGTHPGASDQAAP